MRVSFLGHDKQGSLNTLINYDSSMFFFCRTKKFDFEKFYGRPANSIYR